MNSARFEGRIKFFNMEKGFGFIRSPVEEGGKDIFVHVSEVPQGVRLDAGDLVGFSTKQTRKGTVATAIELLKRGEPKAQKRREHNEEASV